MPADEPTDDDLIRFHNGDTLDNIPVVRLPPAPTSGRSRRTPLIAGVVVVAIAGGIGGGYLAHQLNDRPAAATATHAVAPKPPTPAATSPAVQAAPACRTVHYKTAAGPASCKSVTAICTPGAPWYTTDIDSLCGPVEQQTVRIVSLPTTGGDPGSSYCIAWTGARDGQEREAALLMDAPEVSCTDSLVTSTTAQAIDPTGQGVLYDQPQHCTPLYPGTRSTFPAVLLHQDTDPAYACLAQNNGA